MRIRLVLWLEESSCATCMHLWEHEKGPKCGFVIQFQVTNQLCLIINYTSWPASQKLTMRRLESCHVMCRLGSDEIHWIGILKPYILVLALAHTKVINLHKVCVCHKKSLHLAGTHRCQREREPRARREQKRRQPVETLLTPIHAAWPNYKTK